MSIEFASLVTIYDQYITIIPAIIAGASAIASGIISSVASKKRNKKELAQRDKETQKQYDLQRDARQTEDVDKMKSLKNAGLNANLAYSGGSSISPTISPASVENEGEGLASAVANGGKDFASNLMQNDITQAQVENLNKQNENLDATISKTKAEKDAIELANEKQRGENEGSRFKLQEFGLAPSSIDVNKASGFLSALDFGDEYKTKGSERGARSAVANVQKQLNERLGTDEDFKKRYQEGYISVFDGYVLNNESAKLSQQLQKQEISTFGLRKQALQLGNMKTLSEIGKINADTKKVYVDMEQVRIDTQIARENSLTECLHNVANGIRSGNAEEVAYWQWITCVKTGQFDSFQKRILSAVNPNSQTLDDFFNTLDKDFKLSLTPSKRVDKELSPMSGINRPLTPEDIKRNKYYNRRSKPWWQRD